MDLPEGSLAKALFDHGLMAGDGRGVTDRMVFERPAWPYGHKLKNCSIGAFAYFNAAGTTAAYRVQFGRYSQIGESSIIGPPEHPHDWFSSHPFAFTRPQYMPNVYQFEDFARLGPEAQPGPSFADTMPNDTVIGHEAYVGAGSFIKRGVTIGHGAFLGARSVVTKDVPAYAIAVGQPARVMRLRFGEKIVERMLALQWWRYDLAPYKKLVDFSNAEATLDFFEQRLADGALQELRPDTYAVTHRGEQFDIEQQAAPLYFA